MRVKRGTSYTSSLFSDRLGLFWYIEDYRSISGESNHRTARSVNIMDEIIACHLGVVVSLLLLLNYVPMHA